MPEIAFEIIIIVILTFINGFLSMAEIAIVSGRKTRLQQLADRGNRNARSALQLAESPGDFLSTIQVGITLIGILTGAYGGITIAEQLAGFLSVYPAVAPYAETIGITCVVLAISFLSLILGELVPKRIALSNPERIGSAVARPMQFLSKIGSPLVRFLSFSTTSVLRLIRIKQTSGQPVTEEEVRILIRQGILTGVFEKAEQEMIDAVFRLAGRRVGAIMTSRKDIVAFQTTDMMKVIHQKIKKSRHSHYPLCEGGLDSVLGVVSIKDLLLQSMTQKELDLRSVVHDMPNIPESSSALKALDMLKKSGMPVGLVIDEFGGLLGIVTVNDFAGAIVGVLREVAPPTVIQRKDGSWLIDGLLPFDDLREMFPALQFDEEAQSYTTVGGYILTYFGRIPATGDSFEIANFHIEVVDMDGLRVDKILIVPGKTENE